MNISTDLYTLLAVAIVAMAVLAMAAMRTWYQWAKLRHAAHSAAQWDRLQRDLLEKEAIRSRPVHITAEGITINAK